MFVCRVEWDPLLFVRVPNLNPKCVGAPPVPEDESNLVPELAQDCVQTLGKLATSTESVFEKGVGILPSLERLLRSILTHVHLRRSNNLGTMDKLTPWTLYRMIKPESLWESLGDPLDPRLEWPRFGDV